MKLLKPLVLLFLLNATQVFAVESSHIEAAERLLVVTQAEKMMDQIEPQMNAMLDEMIDQAMPNRRNSEIVQDYISDAKVIMNDSMSWDELRGHIVRIYVNVFSETELYEIIQFYESPVGQMTIEKMPLVMQESMNVTQLQMQEMIPRLQALTEKYVKKAQETTSNQ
ncbi:MAG: DUF2059 domain-containing protein [Gammaproteobacteria bacterium]